MADEDDALTAWSGEAVAPVSKLISNVKSNKIA
jgi:hypothetical protein